MLAAKSRRSRFNHVTSNEGNSKPTPGPDSLPMLRYAGYNVTTTDLDDRDIQVSLYAIFNGYRKLLGTERGGNQFPVALKLMRSSKVCRGSIRSRMLAASYTKNVLAIHRRWRCKTMQGWSRNRLYCTEKRDRSFSDDVGGVPTIGQEWHNEESNRCACTSSL